MLFTEFSFIFIFLPIALGVFFWLPEGAKRITWLVVASLAFYGMWNIYFLPMLIFSLITNYLVACQISRTRNRAWAAFGIMLALVPLLYFKYSGFIFENIGFDFHEGFFGEPLGELLPLVYLSIHFSK